MNTGTENMASGTSIFDPVLCELAYRWFCPPAGHVLDPFAGGSVRGIVAALLGRQYTGVDLSERQIEANREQWIGIDRNVNGETVDVVISGKWMRHRFNCMVAYITSTCHGKCCEGSDKIMVSLLPDEEDIQRNAGFVVLNGLLQPDLDTGKCPHKHEDGLCALHGSSHKPFGCIASPFTLNDNDTLIIRNRYSMMKCHGEGDYAYVTFRASLDLIFGESEAERICQELETGNDHIVAHMPRKSYYNLHYLDGLKHGQRKMLGVVTPSWITGDSSNIKQLAPGEYDLVFTCPPYADLEVYSDDPRDISTMEYPDFLAAYRAIIADSVEMLKDDRFACIVVGDVRDGRGIYRNFVSDTIAAFQDAGAMLYNEAILVTAVGSLPIRVGKQFQAARKLGKTHQNVLVFVKGDPKAATEACGDVYVALPELEGAYEV